MSVTVTKDRNERSRKISSVTYEINGVGYTKENPSVKNTLSYSYTVSADMKNAVCEFVGDAIVNHYKIMRSIDNTVVREGGWTEEFRQEIWEAIQRDIPKVIHIDTRG